MEFWEKCALALATLTPIHETFNQGVMGSNPIGLTNNNELNRNQIRLDNIKGRGYPAYLGGAYSNACPFGGHAAILTKVYTDRRAM